MSVIFSFENFQNLILILKLQKKNRKQFSVSGIIPSELVALNCLYWEENACHRQWMSQQDFAYLQEWLMKIPYPSQWSINMVKVSPCRFEQCLSAFPMLVVEGYCETALFRYLPNNVFGSPQFCKYISYEGHLFFLKVQNLV